VKTYLGNNHFKYSNVEKVTLGKGTPGFTVFPNPVVNRQTKIRLNNFKPGSYTIRIADKVGRMIYQKLIQHGGLAQVYNLQLISQAASGSYQMEIISESGTRFVQSVMID
jgi:hypothetical protein